MKIYVTILLLLLNCRSQAADFKTNSLDVQKAPSFVKKTVVQRISDRIESKLEWKIRRVPVIWHSQADTFSRAHSLGPLAAAVTVKSKAKTEVHIGPLVNKDDYEFILGHELVHVVFYQKYQNSIPDWLEEGFANFLARKEKVDKTWLAKQKIPDDVRSMGHPYSGDKIDIHLQYKISQALVEMLDEKCDLNQLLRLSVKKKIETYIANTCGIGDINTDFKVWLSKKKFEVKHREKSKLHGFVVEEVVKNLHIPWGFEFLDPDTLLINEKNGQLSLFNLQSKSRTVLSGGPKVIEEGQAGSLDVKKHPRYPQNPWIYITYVDKLDRFLTTHLGRFQIKNNKIQNFQKLFAGKGSTDTNRHFGSRIAFDNKNFLYFSMGDRGHRPNGQDLNTHAGSILRLKDDGSVPSDNPFIEKKDALPEIWSYGHRNPQGLVFDAKNENLWAIEHGPRGGDELNLIEKGKNYGWPVISYGKEYSSPEAVGEGTHRQGMQQPVHYYDPSIAPCGMDIYYGRLFPEWEGHLLAGALKLNHINRIEIKNGKFVSEERLLTSMNERVRHVKVAPSGMVYFSTDSGGIYRIRPS